MSSGLLESFYLDTLREEEPEVIRPHPPAPLFPLALGLVVGIAADAAWVLGTPTYIAIFVTAAAGMCSSMRAASPRFLAILPQLRANVLLAICAMAGGGLLHDSHFRHLPEDHIARHVGEEASNTTATGQIVTAPRLVEPDPFSLAGILDRPPRTKFIIALEAAEGAAGEVALTGLVEVVVQEPVFDLYSGDRVRIFGKLYKPQSPNNPGQPDNALAKRRRGIYAGLSCRYAEALQKLPDLADGWRDWLSRLRLEAKTLLLDDALEDDPDKQSLASAMVLGQRSQLDRNIYDSFTRTGVSHFLALSGMHVGLLGLFGWSLGRLAGLSRQITASLVLVMLMTYAVLVEPRPSVIRATVIGTTICLGYVLRRPTNFLNSISLAALILLLWDPLQLFRAAFQLSFVATLGIVYISPVVPRLLGLGWLSRPRALEATPMGRKIGVAAAQGRSRWSAFLLDCGSRCGRYMLALLWMGLAAWLVLAPLGAFHFNRFYTYVWLFTPLLMPVVLLTMISGFAKLLFGLLWPSTSLIFAPPLEQGTAGLIWAVEWLAKVPGATIQVPTPSAWWLMLYYTMILAVILWRSPKLAKTLQLGARLPASLAALTLIAAVPGFVRTVADSEMRVTVLAVGPGSATIIEMPDGKVFLYDAGSLASYDPGRITVVPALRERGIRRIDVAFISHPNFDHYGGLFSLCELIEIKKVVISPHFERFAEPGEPDHMLLEKFRKLGIEIEHRWADPDRLASPEVPGVQILWPPAALPKQVGTNDTSLVIRITHAGRSILLTGDIERYAQQCLLRSGSDLRADVLLLPHHGSVTPLTEQFVAAVQPTHLVCSGHRPAHQSPAARTQVIAGRRYFNTADDGAITITVKEEKLAVQTFLSPRERVAQNDVRLADRSSG